MHTIQDALANAQSHIRQFDEHYVGSRAAYNHARLALEWSARYLGRAQEREDKLMVEQGTRLVDIATNYLQQAVAQQVTDAMNQE